jgi:monofunctional glycosyltransferase
MLWRAIRRVLLWAVGAFFVFYAGCAASLLALRWLRPVTTGVQIERRVEAMLAGKAYRKRSQFVPLARISPALRHAVIAAEDGRFLQHGGIDWKEVEKVLDQDRESGGPVRGASTLTQQLVKNLFFTTHRSKIRKAVEMSLAPLADLILGKARTLELYLNVVEWGPGVYGAEAAAREWYGVSAADLTREQAARLAAILPSPRRRKPVRMNEYSTQILHRMAQMGW